MTMVRLVFRLQFNDFTHKVPWTYRESLFLHAHHSAIMTSDASLPPNAPMTDGTLTPSTQVSQGEADASSNPDSTAPHSRTPSLKDICADIHSRIAAFLAAPATDDRLRTTQEQTRIGIGIIEKALEDYEYVVIRGTTLPYLG